MNKLKVGIVASGMMGQKHADALHRIPGVEVIGIADPYAKDLSKIAEDLGIPNAFSDYREMCETLKPDILHNCTPNHEHFAVNSYAIEHGIGIYSEKPLAASLQEAQELCGLLEKHHVPNAVNFNYRSNAIVREMRARIREGRTGKPLLVHGAYLQDWLMYEDDYNWRLDSAKGGASRTVADIGSHWFDTAQVILDQKIKAVYAKLLTVYPVRQKSAGEVGTFGKKEEQGTYEPVPVDTEDAGMILIRFADGTYGNLVLSQVSGGYKNALKISVDCAKCSVRWEQEEPDHLIVGDREHGETKSYAASGEMSGDANFYATLPGGHPVGWSDALYNSMRLFYQAVRNGTFTEPKQEYATFEDAAYVMRIVEACLKSDKEDCWVNL